MSKKFSIALIGCGMIAETHLIAFQNIGADVVGVYDQNRERAIDFSAVHGIRSYDSLDELLSDDIDIVSVCTPSGTHAALAETIMEHGKYAIVEKPMALTLEDCQQIIKIEKKTGRFCAPISQLRFSPVYRQTKTAIENGLFGKMIMGILSMKYYRSSSYYTGSWHGTKAMDGGGVLMNQGIHGIDIMCGLLGYPTSVTGHTATLIHEIEVEDTAAASLVFPSGALGVINGSTAISHAKPLRLELCGTSASLTIEEDIIVYAEGIDLLSNTESDDKSFNDPAAITTDLHEKQFINILAAVEGKEPLYYTSTDAMNTIAVILAIYNPSHTANTQ